MTTEKKSERKPSKVKPPKQPNQPKPPKQNRPKKTRGKNKNTDSINTLEIPLNTLSKEEMVLSATNHFTKIISTTEIKSTYNDLYWGGNGVGDRWANAKFNYTVLYSSPKTPTKYYGEDDDDPEQIPAEIYAEFIKTNTDTRLGIIGIFAHSYRTNRTARTIHPEIRKEIWSLSCVVCGTHTTVCDHKNDLYNDPRVLDTKTQTLSDFQPLCEHCNLQKRQACKTENKTQRLYSAKNISTYRMYPFEFPWEKKAFDKTDIDCKTDTYWFDPVEFNRKIYLYTTSILPMIRLLQHNVKHQHKVKQNTLRLVSGGL